MAAVVTASGKTRKVTDSYQFVPGWKDDGRSAAGNDRARAVASGGLPLPTLVRFLNDLRNEPQWRREADLAADYYDGNQLAQETLEALHDRGLGPLVRNLIAPTIDAVLGLEEKNRQDWRVVTDLEQQQEVAEGLSQKIMEAERESQADRAISDAYAGAVKTGFAAVEVSRAANPFDYQYRVEHIHRRELYWDPRSRRPDWKDARFVLRRRWFDVDIVCAHFPEHAALIRYAGEGWSPGWQEGIQLYGGDATMLMRAMQDERHSGIEDLEWRDAERGRVCVYEVWYRTFHRGLVLRLPNGRAVEFDKSNPQHTAPVLAGLVPRPQEAVFDRFRQAYFVGPHRIADFPTNARKFPYIPFWGKREDLTGAPYGLTRAMISVQDEVNARLAKMMWLLSSRRTVIDDDAVSGAATEYNDMADVSKEVGNANAFIVLNSNRRNADALRVDENLELADSQHRAMQDAVQAFSQVSGVYAQMLGNPNGLTANSALNTVIDQGTVSLAEINANYIYGRRLVGENLLDLIKEDSLHPHQMTVDTGVTKKSIYFNRRGIDPATGMEVVENDVAGTPVKVQLSDVPSTASYRQQQLVSMSEMAKSMPPEGQMVLAPAMLENSDLPNRKEYARVLRERLGIALDPNSEEGKAVAAQQQQAAQLQQAMAEAELAEKQAKAEKLKAEAEKIRAESAPEMIAQQRQLEADQQRMQTEATTQQTMAQRDAEIAKARAAERAAEAEVIRAQAEAEAARITAESQAEQARAQIRSAEMGAAGEESVKALSEEFDQRLADMDGALKEAMARAAEQAESVESTKQQAALDAISKQLEALQAAMAEAAKKEAEEEKAPEPEPEKEEEPDPRIDALVGQVEQLAALVTQALEARAKPAGSKEIEITDPETGKRFKATVRAGKD